MSRGKKVVFDDNVQVMEYDPVLAQESVNTITAALAAERKAEVKHDPVNHPKHYTDHKSGVECIQITRHMGFNLGNALKYIWRCDLKKDAIEDLQKAIWYLEDEIKKRESEL